MRNIAKRITNFLPVGLFLLSTSCLFAQTPQPGKSEKPLNPPPYSNQPPLGTGLPPEGMTPHDTPNLEKSKNEVPKTKTKKKPAKKKTDS